MSPSQAPTLFAETGELTYNGYTFSHAAHITVSSRQERDEADRTTVYVRHDITAKQIIVPYEGGNPTTADVFMQQLRQLLTQDGQSLTLHSKGFHKPLLVNQGDMRDVKWGPKTDIIHWEPIGSSLAIEMIWTCSVCLPECSAGVASHAGIMALNYEVQIAIDQHGLTTRTISGYLEVAQTRVGGGRTIPDSADLSWERIAIDAPTGYKRNTQRHLSKDKSRLDFTIVDTQLDTNNPWPAKVTDIRGRHSMRVNRSAIHTRRNTLELEVTLEKGYHPVEAWLIFGSIASQRLQAGIEAGYVTLIDNIGVEESLFGLNHRFELGWRTVGPLEDILGETGQFEPIDTQWSLWRESLSTSMFHPRGLSHLREEANFDAIVDLCGPSPTLSRNQPGDLENLSPRPQAPTFQNTTPPADRSWIDYKPMVEPIKDTPTVRMKSVQAGPPGPINWDPNSTGGFLFQEPSLTTVPDGVVHRGSDSVDLVFSGYALRAAYLVPRPSLAFVGNAGTIEQSARYKSWIVGNYFGVPVYAGAWQILYRLATVPSSVTPEDDIISGVINGVAQSPQ